jgi:hypothetical protein
MSLTPGTASLVRTGVHSIGIVATDATGGTPPYAYQWQYQRVKTGGAWLTATGPGVTTRSATIENLGPVTRYSVRLRYTDAAAGVVFSNAVASNTKGLKWFPGLGVRKR